MSETKSALKMSSWAVPTLADDEIWARMTREEQLAAYKELFNSPAATEFSDITVDDVVESSRKARQSARN